ncbi:heterokaryon incompatibility protein-domain-containing protein [Cercophora samala]|uniref:Heterokaryon incompatibility protein-domain-containing protein n=1 Tax=Cercophora samala TaxID=330535 RepID=A0AA39YZ63_9PEZI|nr:heterokaryon incompatibility protein-domain-containing protein [Cercophora samala]
MDPSVGARTLCAECIGITFDDVAGDAIGTLDPMSPWERSDTLPDLPHFTLSAKNGCTFCAFLCYLLREQLPTKQYAVVTSTTAASRQVVTVKMDTPAYAMRSDLMTITNDLAGDNDAEEEDGLHSLCLTFASEGWPRDWRVWARVYQHEGSTAVSEKLGITLRVPSSDVLSQGSMRTIKAWLRGCDDEHPSCQQVGSSWLPTRLIYIGTDDHVTPRLVQVSAARLPLSTRYIALSYCWGPPSRTRPQLTTTIAALPERLEGIPEHIMPGTHRDLVLLARRLGIQYIWIDALCIIQDDVKDWETEAASMFRVYRHAYLTVVAAAGDTCHSGFLSRPGIGPLAVVPFQSRSATDSGSVSGSYLLSWHLEYSAWDANNPSHMSGCSWATRGWTLQEDVLSSRVVYFRDTTAFFRCQTHRCLEHSATIYRNVHRWQERLSAAAVAAPSGGTKSNNATEETDKTGLYNLWRAMVTEYSLRNLTVEEDKLPAISGLARSFNVGLEDEYCAGLWRGDFVRGLLWSTRHDAEEPTRFCAPSWSWASWKGEIGWSRSISLPIVTKCKIQQIHVTPLGSDPFGKVKGGHVDLAGSLCPVSLRPADTSYLADNDPYRVELFREGDVEVWAYGALDCFASSGLRNDGNYKEPDVGKLDHLTDVQALVLALGPVPVGADPDTDEPIYSPSEHPVGLLVLAERHDGTVAIPTYKRVGVFRSQMAVGGLQAEDSQVHIRLI